MQMQTPITKTNKTASTYLLQRRNKSTYITCKTSAHLLCAPCRRNYRGGRRHHADMSVVVAITLSLRPRVLPGHKYTWNISTADIAAGTDTDFVGACTPGLMVSQFNLLIFLAIKICIQNNNNTKATWTMYKHKCIVHVKLPQINR